MLRWICPVHGAPEYAGWYYDMVRCPVCDGEGEISVDGHFIDCQYCKGTGGERYCAEPVDPIKPAMSSQPVRGLLASAQDLLPLLFPRRNR